MRVDKGMVLRNCRAKLKNTFHSVRVHWCSNFSIILNKTFFLFLRRSSQRILFFQVKSGFLQTEPFRRLQAILKMAFTSLLTIQIIHTICRSNSNGSFCFPLVKDNWGCCRKLPYRDHHINA